MSSLHTRLFSFLVLIISYVAVAQTDNPILIGAEGDQFYCPTSEIKVLTSFSIDNPDDKPIDEFFIQISSGYQKGSDKLELADAQPNIEGFWSSNTAKLTLQAKGGGNMDIQDLIDAVKNVVFVSSNTSFSGERFFSFTIGDANFLPSTGHYYQFRPAIGITWTEAKIRAEALDYNGLPGYLATITSREEAQLSGEQAGGAGWIGGSDSEEEGVWKWVTGPEAGDIFWLGGVNGEAPNGAFSFWNIGEPNNLGEEHYAHVTAPGVGIRGSWNDLSNAGNPSGDYQPKGYIVEYGYGGPDDAPDFAAYSRIYTNVIDSVFDARRCGPGRIELRATVNEIEDQPKETNVYWFDSEISTTPVHIGEVFEPELSEDMVYYVLASQDACSLGERKAVSAVIHPIPEINKEVTLKNCDQDEDPSDGYTDFNLEEANDLIIIHKELDKNFAKAANTIPPPYIITYHLTEGEARDGINPLAPFPFNNKTADKVYARVQNLYACIDIAVVNLEVSVTQPVDVVLLESCDMDGENDGFYSFDLNEATESILDQLPFQNLIVDYYRTLEDATLEQNKIEPKNDYVNETPYFQSVFVRVESLDNGDCLSLGEYLELYVFPLPEFEVDEEAVYCTNLEPITLSVYNAEDNYTYEWQDNSGAIIGTGSSITVSSGGQYSVSASSALGCISEPRVINVLESAIATISEEDITIIDGGDDNAIIIDPSNLGIGDYEYALDQYFGPYQNEPEFYNVLPGIHTVYVRDKNGCGISEIVVSVIGYPKFFTPNGDGYNDTWQVKGISVQPGSDIFIYDKFGKLLRQLDASSEGWYGDYKGNPLPSADYWYRVQLEDGRIHTGHFSLIRR